jgi:hypothetical protein
VSIASTSLDSHKFWPLADCQSVFARNEFLDRKDFADCRDRSCWPIVSVPAKSTSINADIGNPFLTTMPQK